MKMINYVLSFIKKLLLTIIIAPIGLLVSILLDTETVFILLKKIWLKPAELTNDWKEIREWWEEQIINKKNKAK